MTYSVWDHANRVYNYYQTPENSAATSAPKPAHLRSSILGMSPEEAAWPLPSGAAFVGTGKYPRGHIASPGSAGRTGLGFFGIFDSGPGNLLLLGALGFVAWQFFLLKMKSHGD
jgi:hypothetical protein